MLHLPKGNDDVEALSLRMAQAAAQEGEALLPSAELAKNLGLTTTASVVLTFSTIVYMQGGLHSYFYAQSAYALAVGASPPACSS